MMFDYEESDLDAKSFFKEFLAMNTKQDPYPDYQTSIAKGDKMMQLPGKLVNELLVILTQHQEFRLEVTCISDKLYTLTIDTQMARKTSLRD